MQLTPCQENARQQFYEFLKSGEQAMILDGYAGTGKTTLVMSLISEIKKIDDLKRAVKADHPKSEIVLTATTNKAAEALAFTTKAETKTIHSHLGIAVRANWDSGQNFLTRKRNAVDPVGEIIFIDEASYIDPKLLTLIKDATKLCKVIYMGDPTQLTPVKCTTTPAFDQNIRKVKLTQVVRQAADNPIQAFTKGLRDYILGGEFPVCTPDGQYIIHLPRDEFEDAVVKEFTREDWKASDSRILAWTNKKVISYNHGLYKMATGRPNFTVGDQVINNHYVSNHNNPIKTDALVTITYLGEEEENWGVLGRTVSVDNSSGLFLPNDPRDIAKAQNVAFQAGVSHTARTISETWVDLRAAYACTVNKSQGSTYDAVFIDLDDIAKCRDNDQLARMLYVAVSRARTKVVMTGDI